MQQLTVREFGYARLNAAIGFEIENEGWERRKGVSLERERKRERRACGLRESERYRGASSRDKRRPTTDERERRERESKKGVQRIVGRKRGKGG